MDGLVRLVGGRLVRAGLTGERIAALTGDREAISGRASTTAA
jgi:hypothetical protein